MSFFIKNDKKYHTKYEEGGEVCVEDVKYSFSNGCILKANKDLPFFGIDKGDILPLYFDGKYLRIGSLSWSPEQIAEEINDGVWTIVENSNEDKVMAKGGEVYSTLWYAIKEHKDWDGNEQHELHGLTWTKAVKKAKEIANEHKKEVRLSTSKGYNNQGHYIYFDYKEGGAVEYDYKKEMPRVTVKFEDSSHNYSTSLSPTATEKDAREYFVGASFDMGVFPKEDFQKCIDIEFFPKGTYKDGGTLDLGINWNYFTLNELDKAIKGKDIQITHLSPEGTDYGRMDFKKDGNKKLSIGGDYKSVTLEAGSENLYINLFVVDEKDKNYKVELYSKKNHKGLKDIHDDVVKKFKRGGEVSIEREKLAVEREKKSDKKFLEKISKDRLELESVLPEDYKSDLNGHGKKEILSSYDRLIKEYENKKYKYSEGGNIVKKSKQYYSSLLDTTVLGFESTWNKGLGEYEGCPVIYYSYFDDDDSLEFKVSSGILVDGKLINETNDSEDILFSDELEALEYAENLAEDENYGAEEYVQGGWLDKAKFGLKKLEKVGKKVAHKVAVKSKELTHDAAVALAKGSTKVAKKLEEKPTHKKKYADGGEIPLEKSSGKIGNYELKENETAELKENDYDKKYVVYFIYKNAGYDRTLKIPKDEFISEEDKYIKSIVEGSDYKIGLNRPSYISFYLKSDRSKEGVGSIFVGEDSKGKYSVSKKEKLFGERANYYIVKDGLNKDEALKLAKSIIHEKKMATGGKTKAKKPATAQQSKMKKVIDHAKATRKEGEAWKVAVKRAWQEVG